VGGGGGGGGGWVVGGFGGSVGAEGSGVESAMLDPDPNEDDRGGRHGGFETKFVAGPRTLQLRERKESV